MIGHGFTSFRPSDTLAGASRRSAKPRANNLSSKGSVKTDIGLVTFDVRQQLVSRGQICPENGRFIFSGLRRVGLRVVRGGRGDRGTTVPLPKNVEVVSVNVLWTVVSDSVLWK